MSGAGVKRKGSDDDFVAVAVGGGRGREQEGGNLSSGGNSDAECFLGPYWSSIASAMRSAGVFVAVLVVFVGLVQICVS